MLGIGLVATVAAAGIASDRGGSVTSPLAAAAVAPAIPAAAAADTDDILLADSLFGLSGKLRMRFLAEASGDLGIPVLRELFGGSDSTGPKASAAGIHRVVAADRALSFVRLIPFTTKQNGRIGTYRIGAWPGETRRNLSAAYANPEGFIEVTPENQNERVSEHFRLRDFLTKGQSNVWPKYLVLDLRLIDKLELVIDELEARGMAVDRMTVMSGFRTPQYNANGGSTAGRASLSRHMYGDAADVFVDNDGNGRMDDLNGDGRVDHRDAQVIHAAAERVEKKYPQLLGGVGVYKATPAHGPFAHVDVRGSRARWGLL